MQFLAMSCFVRHMIRKGIFFELGISASEENADDLESKIANIVGLSGHRCDEVWTEVSAWLENKRLKETLKQKLLE